jgi:hypothetical protein
MKVSNGSLFAHYLLSTPHHSRSSLTVPSPHPTFQTPTSLPSKRAPSSSPPSVGCPTARRCVGSTLRATAAARSSSSAAAACACWARRPDTRWVRLPAAAGCVFCIGCSEWWRICSRFSCLLSKYQETVSRSLHREIFATVFERQCEISNLLIYH